MDKFYNIVVDNKNFKFNKFNFEKLESLFVQFEKYFDLVYFDLMPIFRAICEFEKVSIIDIDLLEKYFDYGVINSLIAIYRFPMEVIKWI